MSACKVAASTTSLSRSIILDLKHWEGSASPRARTSRPSAAKRRQAHRTPLGPDCRSAWESRLCSASQRTQAVETPATGRQAALSGHPCHRGPDLREPSPSGNLGPADTEVQKNRMETLCEGRPGERHGQVEKQQITVTESSMEAIRFLILVPGALARLLWLFNDILYRGPLLPRLDEGLAVLLSKARSLEDWSSSKSQPSY